MPRGDTFMKTTTRSGSGTATGFSSTALTTEKMAVLAPMPSVSAATAARRERRALREHAQRLLEVPEEMLPWGG